MNLIVNFLNTYKKHNVVNIILITLVSYSLLALLSNQLLFISGYGIVIWLPAGISAGILMGHGVRYWPVIFIVAFLNSTFASLDNSGNVSKALAFSFGETTQSVLIAMLASYLLPNNHQFIKSSYIFKWLLVLSFGAMVNPLVDQVYCFIFDSMTHGVLWGVFIISWFANVIGVVAIGSMYYLMTKASVEINPRRKVIYVFSIGTTFAIVLVILMTTLRLEMDVINEKFSADRDRFEEFLVDHIDKHSWYGKILASFLSHAPNVTQPEFNSLVTNLMEIKHRYNVVGLAPVISQSEKQLLDSDASVKNQYVEDIWTFSMGDQNSRVKEEVYFPLQFVAGQGEVVGFNAIKNEEFMRILTSANVALPVVISRPVNINPNGKVEVILFASPVFDQNDKNNINGIVFGLVRFDLLIEDLLLEFDHFHVKAEDITDDTPYPVFLYESHEVAYHNDQFFISELQVGNRTWQLQYHIDPLYALLVRHPVFIWIPFSGFILLLLAGYLSLYISGRSVVLGALVKTRTRELVEKKSLLNSINRLTKVGGWELDIASNTMFWTEECFQIFQLDPDSILNINTMASYMLGDTKKQFEDAIQHALKDQSSWDFDVNISLPNNIPMTLRASGGVIIENNEVSRLYGSFQDITDMRGAERKWLYEHDRFMNLVDSMNGVVWEVDGISGEFIYMSQQVETIFGFTMEQLNRPEFMEGLIFEDDLINMKKLRSSHVKLKQGYVVDYQMLTGNGRIVWLHDVVSITLDQDDKTLIRGITVDITERKNLEQENKSSNELLQSALDIASATAFHFDIIKDELAWESVSSSIDVFNDPIKSSISALIKDVIKTTFNSLLTDKGLDNYKFEKVLSFYDDNTNYREYLVFLKVEFDKYNVPSHINGLCQDVTEKALEDQEKRNLNSQLQQAQKMEAIGQLTGGIAHDFNNILASILGFTSLALDRCVSDDETQLRDYLSEVVVAGEKARDLVSQMLVFSRTSDDEVTNPVDVKLSVQEILKLLQASLPTSVTFHTSFAPVIPKVKLHPVKINQLLMNLCINASHAMGGKGQIEIKIKSRLIKNVNKDKPMLDVTNESLVDGEYVSISVIDTGEGISNEHLQKIFDPFFTTKDVGIGSGMGLSMVLGIVRQYKGYIFVNTEAGVGTEFKILLPTSVADSKANTDIDTQVHHDNESSQKSGNILIVDDEVSIVKFLSHLLEGAGFQVTGYSSSIDALAAIEKDPDYFNLLITDQTMPNLTGLEMIEVLRKMDNHIPVILCSGYSVHMENIESEFTEHQGFIPKPINPEQLLTMINQFIH